MTAECTAAQSAHQGGALQHSTMWQQQQPSAVQCKYITLQHRKSGRCTAVQYTAAAAAQCSATAQCSTVHCSTVQYSTLQHRKSGQYTAAQYTAAAVQCSRASALSLNYWCTFASARCSRMATHGGGHVALYPCVSCGTVPCSVHALGAPAQPLHLPRRPCNLGGHDDILPARSEIARSEKLV